MNNRFHKSARGMAVILVILMLFLGFVVGCNSPKPSETIPTANVSVSDTSTPASNLTEPKQPVAANREQKVPVLYYHSVMVETGNELRMPPKQFEEQMKYLADQGYHTITMDQLYQSFYGTDTLPDKPVLITFDDGYKDNYTNAWPILQKYGFQAAVFVVANYIGGTDFMNWEELADLKKNGWDIEGHTLNHPYLDKLTASEVSQELNAKTILEERLGQSVKYFAYPYGVYRPQIVQALKENGYDMAFTTERGWADREMDPMLLHRIYCYADMGLTEFGRRIGNPNY